MAKLFVFVFSLLIVLLPFGWQKMSSIKSQSQVISVDQQLREQIFEKVWKTVHEKHFDPNFGGVDWKKIGDDYRPKALAAKTEGAFYSILEEMLGELRQSHFGVFPPGTDITPIKNGDGEIGIDLQIIDNEVVITRVEKNTPTAKAGVKPGYAIRKIDGKSTTEILAPVEEKLTQRKEREITRKRIFRRTLLSTLSGKVGSIVKIEVLNEKNAARIFNLERVTLVGEMSAPFGNFPPQRMIFESKLLPGNIGYIRFNIWVVPQMTKLRETINNFQKATGIILDLRGNPGGVGTMTNGLAGLLVDKETSLGTTKSRNEKMELTVYPQENAFKGKVVIVTDAGTGSASELFAAGLQSIGRALVVGETSAGGVLPAVIEKLPDGGSFLFAVSDYKTPTGTLIEGRGIKPDREIKLTRRSLLGGRDLQLETAIKEIKNEK